MIVAMDIEVRDDVLRMAGSQPSSRNDYANKVILSRVLFGRVLGIHVPTVLLIWASHVVLEVEHAFLTL